MQLTIGDSDNPDGLQPSQTQQINMAQTAWSTFNMGDRPRFPHFEVKRTFVNKSTTKKVGVIRKQMKQMKGAITGCLIEIIADPHKAITYGFKGAYAGNELFMKYLQVIKDIQANGDPVKIRNAAKQWARLAAMEQWETLFKMLDKSIRSDPDILVGHKLEGLCTPFTFKCPPFMLVGQIPSQSEDEDEVVETTKKALKRQAIKYEDDADEEDF